MSYNSSILQIYIKLSKLRCRHYFLNETVKLTPHSKSLIRLQNLQLIETLPELVHDFSGFI